MDPKTLVAVFAFTALGALAGLLAVYLRKGRTEDEAKAYLAGFEYVLSDDPDAAIAALSRAAQLNRQTLDTYFALGALFRRKGELERAIRLHCNILLRPGLAAEVRRRAQLELALDYRGAGMRDKAREGLEALLDEAPDHREALVLLRRMHEEAGQWEMAIDLQTRLVRSEERGHAVLAHLLAEAARSRMAQDGAEAVAWAEKAISLHPDSANGLLALGEARLVTGQAREALEPLQRALMLQPELAPRAVEWLRQAASSDLEVVQYLQQQIALWAERGSPFELALALHYRRTGQADQALEMLRTLVERQPRMWEARKELGALLLQNDRSAELRADYEEILGLLGQPALAFRCGSCRQSLPEMRFRCPACEAWDTVARADAGQGDSRVNLTG